MSTGKVVEMEHPLAPFVIMTNEKAIEWEDTAIQGLKQKILGEVKATGEFLRLIKIEEGTVVPFHTHPSHHHTYLISGEMEVGGNKAGPGTYIFIPAGFPHGGFKATKESLGLEVFGAGYSSELIKR